MRMVRTLLCTAIAAVCTAGAASGQTVITQWNFNSNPPDASGTTGSLTPSTGAGTTTTLGSIVQTFGSGASENGSSDPATTDDTALAYATFPAATVGSGTSGARFNVSTATFNNLTVLFDQRNSNTASKFWRFEYTLDGTNFITTGLANGGVYQVVNTGGTVLWVNGISFSFASIPGANNNPNFGFRMTSIFDPAGSAYVASGTASTYAAGGTARFDMVTVQQGATPTGACCVNGTCTGVTTQALCLSSGFNPSYGGDGSTCGTTTCPAAIGACCIGTACNSFDLATCNSISGTWNIGQACTPNNFCDPVAACCFGNTGACLLRNSVDCGGLNGTPTPGSLVCSPNPCPPPPPGACCTGATCALSADPLTCFNGGGQFKGYGSTCGPSTCFVPTGTVITTYDFDTNIVGSPSANLTFLASPDTSATSGHFTATDDIFGVVDRTVDPDVRDDSASATDTFGILRSTETGKVFGVEDLLNPDNATGLGTATWTFNVAGYTGLNITIDMAAMGNFEQLGSGSGSVADSFKFSAALDAGSPVDVFVSNIYEGIQPTYTLESGATNSTPSATSDPCAINGSIILNRFVTFAAPITGTGNTLTLTFSASGDGAQEVFLFDNIVVRGTSGAANGACCSGTTCSLTASGACTGTNTQYKGNGTACGVGNTFSGCCKADYNQSGTVTVQDIFDFLSGYFTSNPQADINGAGGVSVQDIFDYLAAYFAGCT